MSGPALAQITFTQTSVSASSINATYSSTPTAGNLLRASCIYFIATGSTNPFADYSIADVAGNSWNFPSSAFQADGGSGTGDMMVPWVGKCLTHASNKVTLTCTGTAFAGATLIIAEWSGVWAVNNPQRAINVGIQAIGSTTTPTVTVTSVSGDLVDSIVGGNNGQTAAASTWNLASNVGSGGVVDQYKIATGASTTSTGAATDNGWTIFAQSFIPQPPAEEWAPGMGDTSAGPSAGPPLILAGEEMGHTVSVTAALEEYGPAPDQRWQPEVPALLAIDEWTQQPALALEEAVIAPPADYVMAPAVYVPVTEEIVQVVVTGPAFEEWIPLPPAPWTPDPIPFAFLDEAHAVQPTIALEECPPALVVDGGAVMLSPAAVMLDEEFVQQASPGGPQIVVEGMGLGARLGVGKT
jgi:hypothetical protein